MKTPTIILGHRGQGRKAVHVPRVFDCSDGTLHDNIFCALDEVVQIYHQMTETGDFEVVGVQNTDYAVHDTVS